MKCAGAQSCKRELTARWLDQVGSAEFGAAHGHLSGYETARAIMARLGGKHPAHCPDATAVRCESQAVQNRVTWARWFA